MKIYIIIPCLILFLGLFLRESHYYETELDEREIKTYSCSFISLEIPRSYRKKIVNDDGIPSKNYYFDKKSLVLKDQFLIDLPLNFFNKSHCIKELILSSNYLEQIPPAIWKIKNLNSLDLSKNYFKSISNKNLSKLKYFNLEKNQLTGIDINGFLNLKTLKVNDNPLHVINHVRQTNINEIDFSNCNFSVFPNDLFKVNGLQNLDLKNNQMRDFVPLLTSNYLSSPLITIDLSGNYLKEFPATLGHLQQLKTLELDNNEIRGRVVMENFPALLKINLSHQYITSFFLEAGNARLLEEIYLEDNNLTNFRIIGSRIHLKKIDLSRNQLAEIPRTINQITALRILNLSNNNIQKLEGLENLKYLRVLNLGDNPKLKYISIKKLKGLSNLKVLKLANLDLTEKNKNEIIDYCKLREIRITFNPLFIDFYEEVQAMEEKDEPDQPYKYYDPDPNDY